MPAIPPLRSIAPIVAVLVPVSFLLLYIAQQPPAPAASAPATHADGGWDLIVAMRTVPREAQGYSYLLDTLDGVRKELGQGLPALRLRRVTIAHAFHHGPWLTTADAVRNFTARLTAGEAELPPADVRDATVAPAWRALTEQVDGSLPPSSCVSLSCAGGLRCPAEASLCARLTALETPRLPPSINYPRGRWRLTHYGDFRMNMDTLALLQEMERDCQDVARHTRTDPVALILEDDMRPCPGAGQHVLRALQAARAERRQWSAIRVGSGMSGLILRCSDVPILKRFLQDAVHLGPPDTLASFLFIYLHGESSAAVAHFGPRITATYRFNLLQHLGTERVLGGKYTLPVPGCYDLVNSYGLLGEEYYREKCGNAPLSPC